MLDFLKRNLIIDCSATSQTLVNFIIINNILLNKFYYESRLPPFSSLKENGINAAKIFKLIKQLLNYLSYL